MEGAIGCERTSWSEMQHCRTGSRLQDTQWWHVLSLMVFQYDNNDDSDDDEEEEEQEEENKDSSRRSNNNDNGNDGDDHEGTLA